MCWSAEVSLKTFLIGTISAIICLYLDAIPKSLIVVSWSFTLVQLLEYFTWTYINDKPKIYYLSIIGLLLIFLQLFLACYYYVKNNNKNLQRGLFISFIIYIIAYCIFVLPKTKFNMKKGANGHLEWEWLEMPPIFLLGGLIFYIMPILFNKNYAGLIFTLITILISLYYYYKYKTWGTMWCYFSNIIWIFFILFSLYRIYFGLEKTWFWDY
jgi:hypothetical protein